MNEEIEKFVRIRVIIQIVSLVLILGGSLFAILLGGLNFQGNEFKNLAWVIVGCVLFGMGILTLAITEILFVLRMKKKSESEEK